MNLSAELAAWLRVSLTPGVTPRAFTSLLKAFGGPEEILAQPGSRLAAYSSQKVAGALVDTDVSAALSMISTWLDDPNNHVVTLGDASYPASLLNTTDPPIVLYAKGNVSFLNRPSIAVVGSRQATRAGLENSYAFSRALSEAGLVVTSGLALGIDAAAHRGAIDGGAGTIAVVGTGLDIVYPARNRALAHDIAGHGVLVSEFPLGTPGRAENFPRRNRVISGLARGCLVVEAAISSGSLITARLAGEQGLDVFAIPGSIHSPLAKGCHSLIKQGAKLVDTAADILEELGYARPAAASSHMKDGASEQSSFLLPVMGYDPCNIDLLAQRTGVSVNEVSEEISRLELQGVIEGLPGGQYQRIR